MKDLKDILNEAYGEFDPTARYHKDVWNNLIKWYDKSLKHMFKDELLDLLKKAVIDIDNDNFNEIR